MDPMNRTKLNEVVMVRLLQVLRANNVISSRDELYIKGDINEAEWLGDEDE